MAKVISPSATHQGRCDECQEWTQVGWYIFGNGTSSSTLCDPCVQAEVADDPFSSLIERETVAQSGCTGGCKSYCRLCWN